MNRFVRIGIALTVLALGACSRTDSQARAVYILLDISGSYRETLPQAVRASKLLLTRLQPNDSVTIAQIEACSFSDAAVLVRGRLQDRPSAASAMKLEIARRLDATAHTLRGTEYTDITGALYQAGQVLRGEPEGQRYLIVFSDLEEDLPRGCQRAALPDFDLHGIHVVASQVTRLASDNRVPAHYVHRLQAWRDFVLRRGAMDWRVVDDPGELADLIHGRGA